MYGIAKNIWKYLVKSETLLYFVVPKSSTCTVRYISVRVNTTAYPLRISAMRVLLFGEKKGGTPSLYTYINQLFYAKCQRAKQMVPARRIVTLLHLLRKTYSKMYVTNVLQDRHSSELNSRMKSRLTKSESPEYGMMPKNSISRICTTSIIPSWLWAEPLWSFTSAIPRVR